MQILSIIIDLCLTQGDFSYDLMCLNQLFLIFGILFLEISCAQYFQIFDNFSKLVHLVKTVVKDMRFFIILVLYILAGFFLIFYVLQLIENENGLLPRFLIFKYTYGILIGDYDDFIKQQETNELVNYMKFIFFVFSTFFL